MEYVVKSFYFFFRRQYRREILINEEEFCEDCTDTHQFEMDQQRNMNVII